jgi:predicted ATP-grasp superfamily ATP-dependent carboligase
MAVPHPQGLARVLNAADEGEVAGAHECVYRQAAALTVVVWLGWRGAGETALPPRGTADRLALEKMAGLNVERTPELTKPVLVCAFKGWNDAAESATTALALVAAQIGAERFASIDPDDYFDFQVMRPTVHLREGLAREIQWPEHVFSTARVATVDRDLVLLAGGEPNLRWRAFCEEIVGLAAQLGIELVVSLGALLADVPHTRDVRITGIASDAALVERLGFSQARYEGPTGIVGVLHDACARAGMPSASLWAPVPHYVAAVPSPKATLALIGALGDLIGITFDESELEEAAEDYERRLDEAVAGDPEVRAMVERLEQQMDAEEEPPADIPSADTIAREFQRFLRDRGNRDT